MTHTKSILWKNVPMDLHKLIRKAAVDAEITVPEFLKKTVIFYFKNASTTSLNKKM